MIQIAICDDSKDDAVAARNIICYTAKEFHLNVETNYYCSANEIENKLLKKKEPLDILILDIDMPLVSGLELAEKLRSNNLNLIIIFLSNHEEFVFKAIEFQPFRYIRKIKLEIEMPLAICSAAKVIDSKRDKQIILNTDDGEMKIMISEIMYFETEKRKISMHLKNGKHIFVRKTISEIVDIINNEKFVMIHRSCVVNTDYVKSIPNGMVILDNDEKLIVSRTRHKEVKQQFLRLWGEL